MRIQDNILAVPERRLLNALCPRMPAWVTPDRLTALGLGGGAVVLVGDLLSRVSPLFLWLAIVGYGMHWFGDSLDGSLARFRCIERPRYGRYVDHATDALSNFLIMAGLGLTGHVRMDVALFAIAGYLMMSIHVFLRAEALKEFQLSFLLAGPTELRIALVGLTLSMLFYSGGGVWLGGLRFSLYDLPIGFAGVVFVALFCWHIVGTSRILREMGG